MDIDRTHFYPRLLSVLKSISTASFVAVDLEMSGINVRPHGNRPNQKPSLQSTYEDGKAAAERYQVLQIGITCIEADRKRGCYVAKPFNFNVNPLFIMMDDGRDGLKLHRDITLSSSAMKFLLENQSVDMGTVLANGVPYLSQEEEKSARVKHEEYLANFNAKLSLVVDPKDVDAIATVHRTREAVSAWIKDGKEDYLNIDGPLNSFHRRLIHQLIQSEFPAYRSQTKYDGEFMQVTAADPRSESALHANKRAIFEQQISQQKGLSWLFAALTGGDLTGLDPNSFCVDNQGRPTLTDIEAKKREIASLQKDLKTKIRVLVGHNLFMDLLFLTKTFTGSLPDDISSFKKKVHDLFPFIVDTKYLATTASNSQRGNSSLDGLHKVYMHQALPLVRLDDNHTSYFGQNRSHEAGFDSWTTAQLFLKLSAKLVAKDSSLDVHDSDANQSDYFTGDESNELEDTSDNGVPLNPPDTDFATPPIISNSSEKQITPLRASLNTPKNTTPTQSRFSTNNSFAALEEPDASNEDDFSPASSDGGADLDRTPPGLPQRALLKYTPTTKSRTRINTSKSGSLMDDPITDDLSGSITSLHPFSSPSGKHQPLPPSWLGTKSSADPEWGFSKFLTPKKEAVRGAKVTADTITKRKAEAQATKQSSTGAEIQQWIPGMHSPFWETYVNKLRVYSSETEVCDLVDWKQNGVST